MAYNLETLIQTVEPILNPHPHHPWLLRPVHRPQLQSLIDKARSLAQLFENCLPTMAMDARVADLEARIRDAVYEAEDAIEFHFVDQLRASRLRQRFEISLPNLQNIIRDFDLVREEIMKLIDGSQKMNKNNPSPSSSSVPASPANPENTIEGLSNELIKLKEKLTGHEKKLEIIPIVGMGGIGKTTLARNLYDDPLIVSHFDKSAWATVSQDYDLNKLLLDLLQSATGDLSNEICREGIHKLILRLYQMLYGRRYLIVLDDIWSSKAWDDLKTCFPDNGQGSRVVVTTRELSLANYVASEILHCRMNLLDDDQSWNLLRRKVFREENCPTELEIVGKKIAGDCSGLPLAIHAVGGVLVRLDRCRESWESVADDVRLVVANENEHFSSILSLSYNHLPYYLRPCFLYMSAFPEDFEVKRSNLIRLWVAEGFVKPILGKSLEEAAQVYLQELVDRNLLLVCREEIKGRVKSYMMHDMMRELCIRKAREEDFLFPSRSSTDDISPEEMLQSRRLSVHSRLCANRIAKSRKLRIVNRTMMCFIRRWSSYESELSFSESRALRVLSAEEVKVSNQDKRLMNLRYLSSDIDLDLGGNLRAPFYNLQTLIIKRKPGVTTSSLIGSNVTWCLMNMPRLRHVKFIDTSMTLNSPGEDEVVVLEDLQTLSPVVINETFPRVLKLFPNLKKLGIRRHGELVIVSTIDLNYLSKLETLKCLCDLGTEAPSILSLLVFPHSLKKLILYQCSIPLDYSDRIGELPNLEILNLSSCLFESQTWEVGKGGFGRLRMLRLHRVDMVTWRADERHYPRLEQLDIRNCFRLEEIPSGIGEIPTLQIINVHKTMSPSAVESLRRIQEEQLEYGNSLQVRFFL
ncbi:putative late blight resistance protein homolog R1A-10 [Andrographis paniculata]|uniref:putative late blight resistance protein homolog R1A-10 n=1 Tax=Andrographis paniculata TaxID=175694 RepID=UPI0021E70881|nr:putative late blight resistance protein homolog R1A-10 [Andrographis paniculata]